MGASAAAHDRRPRRRGARRPPSDRGQPLLRGPEARGEAARGRLHRATGSRSTSAISRTSWNATGAGRYLVGGTADLRRSLAVPDRRGAALCVPEGDGALGAQVPARGRAARPRRRAAADRRLSGLGAAHPVQRSRDLPALPGARSLAARAVPRLGTRSRRASLQLDPRALDRNGRPPIARFSSLCPAGGLLC